jgi:hypothetical protein
VVEEEEKLTPEQKKNRVLFAKKRAGFDWKSALFTDEKTWQLGSGPKKCWQNPKKRLKREVTRHPKKLHVWAGIGYYFKTQLCIFEGNLDSEGYQRIIAKYLPPDTAPDCPTGKEDDWIFIHDNDPKHKAKLTLKWLEQEAPYFMKDFPPYSPEFNLIEDIWSQMNTAIEHYNINTIPKLKRHLKKAWSEVSWEQIRKSVDSMPTRFQECIKAKGARFGY